MILILLIFVVLAYFVMTSTERERFARIALATVSEIRQIACRRRPELEVFNQALRARTSRVIVTPTLLALNVTIFLFMLFDAGVVSDSQTLIRWGGNFGLRTTNGEWWRLPVSLFVHGSIIQLLVNIATLWQLGVILERLVGRFTFAVFYLAAGVCAGLSSLAASAVVVSAGASGAICGLYGLLLASSIWSVLHPSTVTLPLTAIRRLAPATALFALYNVTNDAVPGAAELTGLFVGFVGGIVVTQGISDHAPPLRRVAAVLAATAAMAVASAVPLRGLTDVRPEIKQIVALEDLTASEYRTASDRLKKRQITIEALVRTIDQSIMPALRAADGRLKALVRVPPEHRSLVADAEKYLRLRTESWRLRAEGLRKMSGPPRLEMAQNEWESDSEWRVRTQAQYRANMLTLGKAEDTERASLEALRKIRSAN